MIFEGDNTHLDDSISTWPRQSWCGRGPNRGEDVNLWFRPLDREKDREAYLAARRDAWISIHGADVPFDGPAFWRGPSRSWTQDPWAVTAVMAREEFAGLLQLSPQRCQEEGAGFLSLCYLSPPFRGRDLGSSCWVRAVSFYRPKAVPACACGAPPPMSRSSASAPSTTSTRPARSRWGAAPWIFWRSTSAWENRPAGPCDGCCNGCVCPFNNRKKACGRFQRPQAFFIYLFSG